MAERRILILFAHPSIDRSEANIQLLRAARESAGVTVVDLYGEYPRFQIDIGREQQRLREHDVVVFMHPLYWYSTPALLKEWQDLVLEYGFAYGREGDALRGKLFFSAVTAGGSRQAYCGEGYNHYTLDELLRPVEQTARLCGMQYLPPFALFGSRTALEDGRLRQHLADWQRLLALLHRDEVDLEQLCAQPSLNSSLDALRGVTA